MGRTRKAAAVIGTLVLIPVGVWFEVFAPWWTALFLAIPLAALYFWWRYSKSAA